MVVLRRRKLRKITGRLGGQVEWETKVDFPFGKDGRTMTTSPVPILRPGSPGQFVTDPSHHDVSDTKRGTGNERKLTEVVVSSRGERC